MSINKQLFLAIAALFVVTFVVITYDHQAIENRIDVACRIMSAESG